MATKFDLLHGDSDRLEGRVLVYGRIKSDGEEKILWGGEEVKISENSFIGKYSSIDAKDIAKKFDCVTDEEISQKAKELEDKFREVRKDEISVGKVPVYTIFVTFDSDVGIKDDCLDDIVYVGEYCDSENCMQAIELGEDAYIVRLKEQMQNTLDAKIENKTHFDLKSKSIKDYILNQYIIPIITSQAQGDEKNVSRLEKLFVEFSENSLFKNEVMDLCARLKKTDKTSGIFVIQACAEIIDAIHLEQYERAAELRDIIKKEDDNTVSKE